MKRAAGFVAFAALVIGDRCAVGIDAQASGKPNGEVKPRISMKAGTPQVTETTQTFDLVLSEEPESRLFVDAADHTLVVAQPGKKTVAPPIGRVRHFTFVERDRLLILEWTMSDGGTERATLQGLDRANWEKLKQFVAAKVGPGLEMRE